MPGRARSTLQRSTTTFDFAQKSSEKSRQGSAREQDHSSSSHSNARVARDAQHGSESGTSRGTIKTTYRRRPTLEVNNKQTTLGKTSNCRREGRTAPQDTSHIHNGKSTTDLRRHTRRRGQTDVGDPVELCSVRVRSSPCSVSARRFVVGPVGRTRACVGFVSDCADALLGLPKTLRQARATQQGPWARSGDSPTSEPSGESSGTHRALPGSDLPTQVPCHPWGLISTTTWCVPSDSPPSSAPSKGRRGICESHPEKSPVGGDLSCTLGPHRYIIPPLGV